MVSGPLCSPSPAFIPGVKSLIYFRVLCTFLERSGSDRLYLVYSHNNIISQNNIFCTSLHPASHSSNNFPLGLFLFFYAKNALHIHIACLFLIKRNRTARPSLVILPRSPGEADLWESITRSSTNGLLQNTIKVPEMNASVSMEQCSWFMSTMLQGSVMKVLIH